MSQANWSVIIATEELSRGSAPPPPLLLGLRGNQLNNWFQTLNITAFFFSRVVYLLLHLLLCGSDFAAACVCRIVKKKKTTRTTTTTQSCYDAEPGMHLAFSLAFHSQGHWIMDGLK